jgi:hypothetical protein
MKKQRAAILLILFYMLPMGVLGEEIDHWETILTFGSLCSYLVPDSQPDAGWTGTDFDDQAWLLGPGGVGYGDGDDQTTIGPALSVYCRYRFEVIDPGAIGQLILEVDFDDGFVAYLNGEEVGRFLMGPAGSTPSWDQPADGLHEANRYLGTAPLRILLDDSELGLLNEGTNVLAIEVHNESIGSSDLSSNIYLHAGINSTTRYFADPPSWFFPPFRSDSTLLPLMVINTYGQAIPDEPRIVAHMGLIYHGPDSYQKTGDPYNVYDGQISIEMRGESSQYFYAKKSFSIETQTDSGTNNNVSLIGLPEENDFVLYGPFGDKSLMRNVITYKMYEQLGHYAPRTRFIELVLNDDYQGLYVLTEKIKRDKNRVDIARITAEDTSGIEVTGGYLMRVDKTTYMDPSEYWTSPVTPPVAGYSNITYQFHDPEYDELNHKQRLYMWSYLLQFETALASPEFTDPEKGYRSYLDIPSFIDLMILNEFVKDVDGFRLSHYFYKQKDSNGGKLVNGPPWDYNLTFGNSDYTEDVHLTYNWTYTLTNTMYWWARAMEDPWFRNRLYCRWDELYGTFLNPLHVSGLIDSLINEMGDAVARNFQRWPILGTYQWPNSYVGQTYAEEEEYLRSWIDERLEWINGQWGGACIPASEHSGALIGHENSLRVYPNPSDLSHTFFSINPGRPGTLTIRLYDITGKLVHHHTVSYTGSEAAWSLPDLSYLPAGIYTLEVTDREKVREICRVIRQ